MSESQAVGMESREPECISLECFNIKSILHLQHHKSLHKSLHESLYSPIEKPVKNNIYYIAKQNKFVPIPYNAKSEAITK